MILFCIHRRYVLTWGGVVCFFFKKKCESVRDSGSDLFPQVNLKYHAIARMMGLGLLRLPSSAKYLGGGCSVVHV